MTYGEELFHADTPKTSLYKLEKIQSKSLRIITRMPASCSNHAIQAITKIPPLEIRRKAKKAILWARVVHNTKNPAGEVYDAGPERAIRDPNRPGIQPETLKLIKNMNLTKINIMKKQTPLPPWTLPNIDIDTSLAQKIDKKQDNPNYINLITREHIDTYTDTNTQHYYTDGSKVGPQVGAGIYSKHPLREQAVKLDNNLSILSAELFAISMALMDALRTKPNNSKICIFTDSLSSCMAIRGGERGSSRPDLINNIEQIHSNLTKKGCKITITWIPLH